VEFDKSNIAQLTTQLDIGPSPSDSRSSQFPKWQPLDIQI